MNLRHLSRAMILSVAILNAPSSFADGPKDNQADKVRPIPPPPAIEPTAAQKSELQAGVAALGKEIEATRAAIAGKPELLALLPDVQIFYNAVHYAVKYNELYYYVNAKGPVPKGQQPKPVSVDLSKAKAALAAGMERAKQLREGQTPWLLTTGPRGYLSKIDGSVQPYLLYVPPGYKPGDVKKYRVDLSAHGRGETLAELNFLNGKADPGTGSPDKFVVALYGRYCCANKFAGEVDLFEALDAVKKQYPIDENRVLTIGFSMGGAACWQFATHDTDTFAAASPGAGFAETREFLHIFQDELVQVPWYEQALWHWYDCTDYAVNLFNLPTIAYAGEIDKQKQASDIMEKAMTAEGLKLDRIIGPKTAHAYEKNAKIELDKRLDEILAKGRNRNPEKIRFTTWTLRYNHMDWVIVDGLEKHWKRARVDAERNGADYVVKTENVTMLTLAVPLGSSGPAPTFTLDGQKVENGGKAFPNPYQFVKGDGKWSAVGAPVGLGPVPLAKTHGLQGPIDDAFMDRFVIVLPTGKPLNEKLGAWAGAEAQHAIDHWRKQFRGEPEVVTDSHLLEGKTPEANLILFGDPSSNAVLKAIAKDLPIKWTADSVIVGLTTYPADRYVPVFIFPNPRSPGHYVVVNSGFTYREYDYLNNARQIAKLPDYAVVDIAVPVTSRSPGSIKKAGFFGEKWELLPDDGKR